MSRWGPQTRLSLAAVAMATLAGCQAEPPPTCLVLRATNMSNYLTQYTNMVIVSANPGDPDCALFTTTVPRATWGAGTGVPNYLYPAGVSSLGGQLGGQPFRVDVVGLDKFAPTAVGSPSLVSIAPDILGGASGAGTSADGGAPPGTAFGIGPLEDEAPDAKHLCYVRDFPPFGAPVDWGEGVGLRDTTFHFSEFAVYVTALVPGTQFQAKAEITIGACTAGFDVVAYAPASTCAIIDDRAFVTGPRGGVQPLTPADVDPGLCANFNPDESDPQWGYYGLDYATGGVVNRYFPISCDALSGYCVLPVPTAPAVPTVPIISSTARP